jgi:hypothetical protein
MASKIKVDQIQTADGTGTIALQNQLSGMTTASLPTGSVLQVVSASLQDEASTTSGSFVSSGLTATITPSSTSNKILVTMSAALESTSAGNATATIFRGTVSGTNLGGNLYGYGYFKVGTSGNICASELDSPSTTSAQTYTVGIRNDAGGNTNICNGSGTNANTSRSTLTLVEIAG